MPFKDPIPPERLDEENIEYDSLRPTPGRTHCHRSININFICPECGGQFSSWEVFNNDERRCPFCHIRAGEFGDDNNNDDNDQNELEEQLQSLQEENKALQAEIEQKEQELQDAEETIEKLENVIGEIDDKL